MRRAPIALTVALMLCLLTVLPSFYQPAQASHAIGAAVAPRPAAATSPINATLFQQIVREVIPFIMDNMYKYGKDDDTWFFVSWDAATGAKKSEIASTDYIAYLLLSLIHISEPTRPY